MRTIALVLSCMLPALAAAKSKVLVDAPKSISPALQKALKAKYAVGTTSLSSDPTGGEVKEACLAEKAIAVVTARQNADVVTVMVLNGANGDPLGSFKVKAKKPLKALGKPDVKKLMSVLSEARAPKAEAKPPPEEPKPPPEERKPPPEEKKPEPVAERPRPTEPPPPPGDGEREDVIEKEGPSIVKKPKPQAVRFAAGLKMFSRQFGYTDDIFDALSTYKLGLGPAITVQLDLYPAAFVTSGFAANIGIMGNFDYAVGIRSRSSDGTLYSTSALGARAALTARIPLGPVRINPFFGFSLQTYAITSSGAKPNIPNVGYTGLRGGLQVSARIVGPVGVLVSFAGQYLLSTGEIGSAAYFPHLKAGGLDAQLAIPIAITDLIEVRLSGDYTRFWYKMNPVPGEMSYVAGGALDIYAGGTITVAVTL